MICGVAEQKRSSKRSLWGSPATKRQTQSYSAKASFVVFESEEGVVIAPSDEGGPSDMEVRNVR